MVAKELVASHGLKQIDAAHVAGVSDPLVEIKKCEALRKQRLSDELCSVRRLVTQKCSVSALLQLLCCLLLFCNFQAFHS